MRLSERESRELNLYFDASDKVHTFRCPECNRFMAKITLPLGCVRIEMRCTTCKADYFFGMVSENDAVYKGKKR